MTYKLVKQSSLFECEPHGVFLVEENLFIPFAEENVDYQRYLLWLEEGNEPLPAD